MTPVEEEPQRTGRLLRPPPTVVVVSAWPLVVGEQQQQLAGVAAGGPLLAFEVSVHPLALLARILQA